MTAFKPQLETLGDRTTPSTLLDGPRPLGIDGLPLPATPPPPQGSPVITIDVLVIQWVTARL